MLTWCLRQVLQKRWEVILRSIQHQQSLSLATQRPLPWSATLRGGGKQDEGVKEDKSKTFTQTFKKTYACPLPVAWRCKREQTAAASRSSWCKRCDRHSASRLSVRHKNKSCLQAVPNWTLYRYIIVLFDVPQHTFVSHVNSGVIKETFFLPPAMLFIHYFHIILQKEVCMKERLANYASQHYSSAQEETINVYILPCHKHHPLFPE